MADQINFTDGETVIQLYYDTDGFQVIEDGVTFNASTRRSVYHEDTFQDGDKLVSSTMENRRIPMMLAARGSDTDDIADLLSSFNHLVLQARRHAMTNSGNKCYLDILLDGSTQHTYYDVIDVEYESADLMSYFNRKKQELIYGDGFRVVFVCLPWGYGASETLANEVINPHFEEADIFDYIANGWSLVGDAVVYNSQGDIDVEDNIVFAYTSSNEAYEWISQPFTASANSVISDAYVYLAKTDGTPGSVYAAIYTDNGSGKPSATQVGGNSDSLVIDNLDLIFGIPWSDFGSTTHFRWSSNTPTLTSGADYHLVLKTTGYSSGALVTYFIRTESADGVVCYYDANATPTWEIYADAASLVIYSITTTAVVASMNTSTYVCGSQSQKIIVDDATTGGIKSINIGGGTVALDQFGGWSAEDYFSAYAWVYRSGNGDDITLDIVDEAGASQATTTTYATYDVATTTKVDSDGNTWKRLEVSGKIGAAVAGIYMTITRASADATQATTFYIDQVYFHSGSTAVSNPTGWASCQFICNYTETSIDGKVNYIDVCDIPGDLDARTSWKFSGYERSQAASFRRYYIGKWSKRNIAPKYWYEFNDETSGVSAGRTAGGTTTSVSVSTTWVTVATATWDDTLDGTSFIENNLPGRYMLAAAVKSGSAKLVRFRTLFSPGYITGGLVQYSPITTYTLRTETSYDVIMAGPFGTDVSYRGLSYLPSTDNTKLILQAKLDEGTINLRTDFFCLIPVDEAFAILRSSETLVNDQYIAMIQEASMSPIVLSYGSNLGQVSFLGSIPMLSASRYQRFVTMNSGISTGYEDQHTLAYGNVQVDITYAPRTEFLLGS